jgi:protein SCO1
MHRRSVTLLAMTLLALPFRLGADEKLPAELEDVGIVEHLGSRVDLDLEFVNESGRPVKLREYFASGKPVLLTLAYYTCPMLCNLILNGETSALKEVPWTPGDQFEVVTVSFDDRDTPELARKKKANYLEMYGKPDANGWHFLTDYNENVKKLADQVGFHYKWDEQQEQFAHAAVIMFLTPDGRISRYLYGIKFSPRDVRLALTEAGEGKMGSTVDRLLLYCFHYDPSSKGYTLFAINLMRAGGALTVLILVFLIWRLLRRERLRPSGPMGDPLVTSK